MSSARNLVAIIGQADPAALKALQSRFPQEKRLLSAGKDLGEPEVPAAMVADQPTPPGLAAMVDLAEAGIKATRVRVDALLARVLHLMAVASRIKLVGALVASASGLVTAFLAFSDGTKPYGPLATAVFSFFGGLATILADQVIRAPSGRQIASAEEHGKILAIRLDLERAALRLARQGVIPLTREEAGAMLDHLDEDALAMIGYEKS